jgi:glycerol uptake facilitator-like aquaporin
MEVSGGKNNKLIVCLYEALGTCFLLIAINWGSDSGTKAVGYQSEVVAVIIFGCIINFGPISGAHFNPALTVGVLIKEGSKNFSSNLGLSIMIIIS